MLKPLVSSLFLTLLISVMGYEETLLAQGEESKKSAKEEYSNSFDAIRAQHDKKRKELKNKHALKKKKLKEQEKLQAELQAAIKNSSDSTRSEQSEILRQFEEENRRQELRD